MGINELRAINISLSKLLTHAEEQEIDRHVTQPMAVAKQALAKALLYYDQLYPGQYDDFDQLTLNLEN